MARRKTEEVKSPWKEIKRESGLTEWRCEHGVGHPDMNSIVELGDHHLGTHGCDGCCGDEKFPGTLTYENWFRTLKVGSQVAFDLYGADDGFFATVEAIYPAGIINADVELPGEYVVQVSGHFFKGEYGDFVEPKGSHDYHSIQPITNAMREREKRRRLISNIRSAKLDSLSTKKLEEIHKRINDNDTD